ncbi:MAG: FkbM family methyltransferase, partial [bacterium]
AGSMYAGHARSAAKAGRSVEAPTVTVDHLCDLYTTVPDLMKIDVEGAENEVLRGSKRCARHAKTRFLVEMHSPPELPMVKNAARVLAWCEEVGFAAWYLADETRLEKPAQVGHRGRCHVLLQPSAWPYPEWLKGIKQSADLEAALASTKSRVGGAEGAACSQMDRGTD